jgi:stearoyl-CoA desaturase (Delta-9 desaturase)
VLSIFSISAGYHRLFSHRAYEAHPLFRLFCLLVGAGTFQNSAIAWAADHRRHHSKTDSDLDPYDATRGFWYSHIGWVLRKDDPDVPRSSVKDLEADPLVMWQDRHYPIIGTVMGFVLPLALGFVVGDPWGGLIIGGPVRLVFAYHATFAVNSLAHMVGFQPFSDRNTSRDSLLIALITMGEGYHNYHHAFPADYRMGVRPFQYDPTKWIIRTLSFIGLTRRLRRTPASAIAAARLRMKRIRLGLAEEPPTLPPAVASPGNSVGGGAAGLTAP